MNVLTFSEGGHGFVIEMSATLENVDKAAELVSEKLTGRCGAGEIFRIILGAREALTNAFLHGSSCDPEKRIRCSVEILNNRLTMEVEDEGAGFDWTARPVDFPEPDHPGGRGLVIIKTCFDGCSFNEKGNKILLTASKIC